MKKFLAMALLLSFGFIQTTNATVMTFLLHKLGDNIYYFWDSDFYGDKKKLPEIVKKHKLIPVDSSIGFAISDMAIKEFECGKEAKCDYSLINNFVKTYNNSVKIVKNKREKLMKELKEAALRNME